MATLMTVPEFKFFELPVSCEIVAFKLLLDVVGQGKVTRPSSATTAQFRPLQFSSYKIICRTALYPSGQKDRIITQSHPM